MARPGPFEEMFNLKIGEQMAISPGPGEPVDKALKRIKLRASKYRAHERYYVVEKEEDAIHVMRVPLGKNKKLWRYDEMKMGERILFSANPTAADLRSAQNRVHYLHNTGREKQWRADMIEGRLYITCAWDNESAQRERERERERERREALENSPREKLIREIALYEGSIRFSEQEMSRNSSAGAQGLIDVIVGFGEHVDALKKELAKLDAQPDVEPER